MTATAAATKYFATKSTTTATPATTTNTTLTTTTTTSIQNHRRVAQTTGVTTDQVSLMQMTSAVNGAISKQLHGLADPSDAPIIRQVQRSSNLTSSFEVIIRNIYAFPHPSLVRFATAVWGGVLIGGRRWDEIWNMSFILIIVNDMFEQNYNI